MNISLSQRALDYLNTLERVSRVSPERLKVLMLEQGIEPVDIWLAFQESYAGHVESLGYDGAVWGIAHESKRYFEYPKPYQIEHDYYEHEKARVVTCADVHATYDYTLTEDGRFLGRPCDRFEIYIEQNALWREFIDLHTKAEARHLFNDTSFDTHLDTETRKIPEASDSHHTYVVNDTILGIKEEQSNRWVRVLLADPPPKLIKERESGVFGGLLSHIKSRIAR